MSEGNFKENILAEIRFQIDMPEETKLQFNFETYAKQITTFLLDKKLDTPFTIGIHGVWGSGKTTLIKKVEENLKLEKNNNHRIIFFDAWKYERIDIVSALLQKIKEEFKNNKNVKDLTKTIGLILADQVVKQYTGLSVLGSAKKFEELIRKVETVSDSLEKIVKDVLDDGRLIIIIDDLDRCHIDNVLDMLEAIKMLLCVKNVIFVIAVDMEKIEHAWALRYGSYTGIIEGRDHVDKIFQLKLSIPPKTDEQMEDYLKKLAVKFANEDLKYFIKSCPGNNPRKVKRMLNLLYFILSNYNIPGKDQKEKNKNFDSYFETMITWISLTMNHQDIAKKIIHAPSSLIIVSTICKKLDYLTNLKSLKREIQERKPGENFEKNQIDLKADAIPTMEILEEIIEKDELAFMTLKRYATKRKIDFVPLDDMWPKKGNPIYDQNYLILNEIIKTAGLIGI